MTPIHHVRRGVLRVVAATLLVLAVAAVVGPAGAGAHARLSGTAPADGSRVGAPPERVTLTFAAKHATLEGDPVRVHDPDGRRIDAGDARLERGGEALSVGIAAGSAPPGRYEVVYRVVSADSHVVAGRFGFTVTGSGPRSGPSAGSAGSAPAERGIRPAGPADVRPELLAASVAAGAGVVARRRRRQRARRTRG